MKQNDNHSAPDFTDSTQIAHIVEKSSVRLISILLYLFHAHFLWHYNDTPVSLYCCGQSNANPWNQPTQSDTDRYNSCTDH